MNKILTYIIITGALFSHIKTMGQDSKYVDIWINYQVNKFVKKNKFWLQNDLDFRYSFSNTPSSVYTYKLNAKFNIANVFDFRPGINFRYTYISKEDNIFETRTWQGINLNWPNVWRVNFEHLYRFEQRFIYNNSKYIGNVGLRSRYRLSLMLPLNNKLITDNTFYINISSEYFFKHDKNIKERFSNNIRSGIAIGYRNNYNWKYYITLYANRGKDNLNDNRIINYYIVSFTVKNNLNINKK